MKRELKRQKTLQLILDTTKRLVSEKGCSQLTLHDIVTRSGLSKGAIYHYVKSKNELFALILLENLNQTNRKFLEKAVQDKIQFDAPFEEIVKSLTVIQDPNDVINKIFVYLLGQSSEPSSVQVLQKFYKQAIDNAKNQIIMGQKNDVITNEINADEMAELFVLVTYGLRIRNLIPLEKPAVFDLNSFIHLITNTLKAKD